MFNTLLPQSVKEKMYQDPALKLLSRRPAFAINNDNTLLLWNDACARLTGISAERALGTSLHDSLFRGAHDCSLATLLLYDSAEQEAELKHSLEGLEKVFLSEEIWTLPQQNLVLGEHSYTVTCMAHRCLYEGRPCVVQVILPGTRPYRGDNPDFEDYKELVENIGDGFLLNQNNKIVLANKALAQLWGYDDPRELIGKNIIEFIADSHREQFLQAHQEKLEGQLSNHTWPHRTRSGHNVWLEGHPKFILWKGAPAIITTLVNVTEARKRERCMQKEAEELRQENSRLRSSLVNNSWQFQEIVGKSLPMRNVYDMLMKAAEGNSDVIIYGESGTGKELAAAAIHRLSNRVSKPFVTVNCGAIPSELLESEFFGVKKGAFTGAYADRKGYLDQVGDGVLFLDEIGELPLPMQVKLLRVIESRTYSPVGSPEVRSAGCRIIAATNRNLINEVAAGNFREDLFYRLHVVPIYMPPLRDRKEDIPLLLECMIARYGDKNQKQRVVPHTVLEQMYKYDWPGNIREFANTVQRWLTLGTLDLIHTPSSPPQDEQEDAPSPSHTLSQALSAYEKKLIAEALKKANGNRTAAARLLGISRRNLYRKLESET